MPVHVLDDPDQTLVDSLDDDDWAVDERISGPADLHGTSSPAERRLLGRCSSDRGHELGGVERGSVLAGVGGDGSVSEDEDTVVLGQILVEEEDEGGFPDVKDGSAPTLGEEIGRKP
jgi:hypothetical protein